MQHHLLLVQDDAKRAKAVNRALVHRVEPCFDITWVRTCAAALQCLVAGGRQPWAGPGSIAAVLVELNLPDAQGMAAFDRLFAASARIPLLILTSPADEETAKLAVQRGAEDYFFNDRLDGYLLPKVLASVIHRAEDTEALRALSQRMAHLAHYDSLTDLPNRALLTDRLEQAMALAHRHDKLLAVLHLDVDRFKHINDSLGHAAGDRLLQSIAGRLRDCIRDSDTVSRQGGDEFIVLCSEVQHPQDAAECAEKIMQAITVPHRVDDHDIHISVSIGIVLYPDDGKDADTLLKNADFAMYQAKDSGRNTHQFYKADLNSTAAARQSLENDLRYAVQRREFELHYQPNMNVATGAIAGVEALIRWRHPVRGLIPPLKFIPIAEESGLIVSIGQWVLREGCRQGKVWQDAGLPRIRLAVNISAVELRARDFVSGVRTILAETGFDPQRLELELTETFLMQESTATDSVLRAIKDMGVKLALDDFGTGYSSLSYMRRFPIDALKVDQSFIRDLTTDADDASIVGAVINMGKSLHMRVIAEGVETREQLTFLEEHQCPEAQGYYFSHPLIAQDCAAWMRHSIGA